ncbi:MULTISPECIES: pentapeptide repeat-containing protein [Nostocales]|uniref:Pentapeptide repeat-containing protein n=1 Tax=Scytonema tolypothrichoides VB-61278_2 TaxID=3232314 RepID=A0ABW8WK56_9CYAN|nr:pentapeptide repeat-containing protein [Tolypothrix bouteillei]
MRGSDLRGATLGQSCLEGADLSDADLRGAFLEEIFGNMDLTDANLMGAQVGIRDLRDAILCNTVMPDGSIRNDHC